MSCLLGEPRYERAAPQKSPAISERRVRCGQIFSVTFKIMKNYELAILVSPELQEEEMKNFLQKVSDTIQQEGGSIKEAKSPIKKKLGNEINGAKTAFFAVYDFDLEAEKLDNLKQKLKEEKSILRFMLVIKRKFKIKKAPRRAPVRTAIEKPVAATSGAVKPKEKVELKEIEKQLEEILGE